MALPFPPGIYYSNQNVSTSFHIVLKLLIAYFLDTDTFINRSTEQQNIYWYKESYMWDSLIGKCSTGAAFFGPLLRVVKCLQK